MPSVHKAFFAALAWVRKSLTIPTIHIRNSRCCLTAGAASLYIHYYAVVNTHLR
jgi:hypothetical protein